MFYRLFSFLKFWMASSNQHGVHSPFVYHYVTQCLYAAPNFNGNRSHNILLKTVNYFKITKIQLTPNSIDLERKLTKNLKGVTSVNSSGELIFLGTLDSEAIEQNIVQNVHLSHDTIVYVDNIYKTANTNKMWRSIKELEQVRVTIDLFYGGLVFFRTGQVKEHFKIRI